MVQCSTIHDHKIILKGFLRCTAFLHHTSTTHMHVNLNNRLCRKYETNATFSTMMKHTVHPTVIYFVSLISENEQVF
jgi:hypothetical protein